MLEGVSLGRDWPEGGQVEEPSDSPCYEGWFGGYRQWEVFGGVPRTHMAQLPCCGSGNQTGV